MSRLSGNLVLEKDTSECKHISTPIFLHLLPLLLNGLMLFLAQYLPILDALAYLHLLFNQVLSLNERIYEALALLFFGLPCPMMLHDSHLLEIFLLIVHFHLLLY